MNYYEHHIGDYAEATAHLSFVEDAAYSRLIRKYYASEKPLPAELKAVQRLVGARTKDEREAVGTVLEEFFTLQDDGWHNARCDEEVEKFQSKQPNAEAKKGNDRERQRRSRERRKALFDELRSHGVVAPWDATNEQLHVALSRVTGGSGHAPVTQPVTRDNTGTQTPDTSHQSPDSINTDDTHSGSPTRAGAVCVALRAEGMSSVNSQHPDLLALLGDGAEIQEFVEAARIAKDKGKGFAYVLGIVKGQRADAQRMAAESKEKPKNRKAKHDGHDVEEPA